MNGGTTAEMDLFVQPKGVVRRRSTDILVVDDPYVTALVQYIRDHVSEPFGVERLSSVVPVSRRWLEIRFKQCLDCTPLEYIRRVRVERAKELLGSLTPHSMDEVAAAAGFQRRDPLAESLSESDGDDAVALSAGACFGGR